LSEKFQEINLKKKTHKTPDHMKLFSDIGRKIGALSSSGWAGKSY